MKIIKTNVMRIIKFRAWDKKEKTMIVDEQTFIPLIVTNKGVMKLNPKHKEDNWFFIDKERFVIEQFTGLKDSNGVDIYEGDIVINTYLDEHIAIVEYDDVNPTFRMRRVKSRYSFSDIEYDFVKVEMNKIKVIGNIHQNPELLEK